MHAAASCGFDGYAGILRCGGDEMERLTRVSQRFQIFRILNWLFQFSFSCHGLEGMCGREAMTPYGLLSVLEFCCPVVLYIRSHRKCARLTCVRVV
jgi:hypothetical protein